MKAAITYHTVKNYFEKLQTLKKCKFLTNPGPLQVPICKIMSLTGSAGSPVTGSFAQSRGSHYISSINLYKITMISQYGSYHPLEIKLNDSNITRLMNNNLYIIY